MPASRRSAINSFTPKQPTFLVEAEGEVDRERRPAFQEQPGMRDRGGDEALHVGGAAAVQAPVPDDAGQRIDRPVLAVPGHRVRVAGQDDAGGLAFAQGGEQVGLGALRVVAQPGLHPQPGELVADAMDELKVGVRADGVEADQVRAKSSARGRGSRDCHAPHSRGISLIGRGHGHR
jgi:hypothetical protein